LKADDRPGTTKRKRCIRDGTLPSATRLKKREEALGGRAGVSSDRGRAKRKWGRGRMMKAGPGGANKPPCCAAGRPIADREDAAAPPVQVYSKKKLAPSRDDGVVCAWRGAYF